MKNKKSPSGPRVPLVCRIAGRSRRRPIYLVLEGCTLQRRIVPTGGRKIPARPRDSGSFIHFALDARCRRIRLLRVLSHSHGAPALGVNFERARGKRTESPRANLAPGIREQRIVLVSRCEHAACRLSLGCFDPSYQRSRAISSVRAIFFVEKHVKSAGNNRIRVATCFAEVRNSVSFYRPAGVDTGQDVGYDACVLVRVIHLLVFGRDHAG